MKVDEVIEKLEWDSEFFNKNVYRIKKSISSKRELKKITDILEKFNVDLCYYSSATSLSNQESGPYDIIFVDKKVTYSKEINKKNPSCGYISVYENDYPDNILIELAIQSGTFSRFKFDKRIGTIKYEELYKKWIINSVNKRIAKEVLVYRDDNLIKGVVTLGEKNLFAEIGLIAVDINNRGRGIGKSLMFAAENWFVDNNYDHAQVVTQGNNLIACNLYESCGYKRSKVEYIYHLWRNKITEK